MTTEIREIPGPGSIRCYMIMRLTAEGNFTDLKPTYGTHKILGGYWADLAEAQHEQMMQALKGIQYRVFEIDWKL